MDNKTRNTWIDMISKVYVNLHNSQRVLNSSNKSDKKRERIIKYFNRLEEVHNKVSKTKSASAEKILKNFYYDLYIIKPENIPESYFNNQIVLARERGYGNITLTDKDKERMIKQVIDDQKETLDKWIEYFLYDEESKSYEMWEKYWVFQGLQTLGKYDKETYKFSKRDKTTVYPFPPVEREYIFTTLKLMEDFIKDRKTEDEIKNALEAGNFKLLYEYVIKQSMLRGEKQSSSTAGKWIKYEQGSDYNILRNSLQGYYTGWCTGAGENFAKDQLANGDFYVYYTLDNNGEAKVPRIAIRMDGSTKIGEIRGIADKQNMEPEMMPILEEKIKEFPDREKYYKKERDMKLLTLIDKKVNKNIELSLDELKFLYEIDNEIEGFGYEKDPRIQEIKNKRNQKNDCLLIFNVKESEVASSQHEWESNPKRFKVLLGNLEINKSNSINDFFRLKYICGNLYLGNLKEANDIIITTKISDYIVLNNLTFINSLTINKNIGGYLDLSKLRIAQNLILPEIIGGDLELGCLKKVENLVLPKIVKRGLNLRSLTNAQNLILPEFIGGYLDLSSIQNASNLIISQNISGYLSLQNLTTANGLVLPKRVGSFLDLRSLLSADTLVLPLEIGGNLYLDSLTSAENLEIPLHIGGYVDLRSLQSVDGLKLPYGFNLNKLRCSNDIKNEIMENPDKYFMAPSINGEKIKKLK